VAVASAGPYASLHLAPDRYPRQHPTTQFFTGRMPFLPPNQQRQSTEGITYIHIGQLTFGSQGLDYTYTIHAFIHTHAENKIELGLLKIGEHRWKKGISVMSSSCVE